MCEIEIVRTIANVFLILDALLYSFTTKWSGHKSGQVSNLTKHNRNRQILHSQKKILTQNLQASHSGELRTLSNILDFSLLFFISFAFFCARVFDK
jgi:hypothetical protein